VPGGAVRGEAAAADQAVDVRVQVEPLVPGVQHREHGGGLHQHGVAVALMGPQRRAQLGRHGHGDVEVRHRQHLGLPVLEPFAGLGGVALGATAVAAGMVGERLDITFVAAPDLAAERSGAAVEDVGDGAPMRGWHRRAVRVEVVRREATEHVGDLDHDRLRQRPVIRRSSKPCSDARVGVVRWV